MRCYKDAPYYFTLTASLPPMHPFCSESNNLGKGEWGQGVLNLW